MKSSVRVIGVALMAMLIGIIALATTVLAQGPPTPHLIAGQEQCLTCHSFPTLPADHEGRPEASCAFCHPESEDAEPVAESPATPHPIAGREQCLLCHAYGTLPSNHEGRDEAGCATCHPAAGSAPPSGPMGDQGCLSCHSQPGLTYTFSACEETLSLTVDEAELAASVHGKAGVTCTGCHTAITGYPHPPVTAEDCRAFTVERSEACANCHSDITAAQHDSIHYELLAEGDPNAPTCVDCHGSHGITPPDEPRHKLSLTCGNEGCHASILLAYEESAHGSVIAREEDNPYVPVCEDCHGAHQMPDPRTGEFHEASPELCATCHADENIVAQFGLSTDVYQDYRDGIHAQLHESNPNLQTPVCTDCHGIHEIRSADDPKSTVHPDNLNQACRQCHPDAPAQFASAWTGHFKVTQERQPLTYYVNLFYMILIPLVIGAMVLFVLTDIGRRVINHFKRGKAS